VWHFHGPLQRLALGCLCAGALCGLFPRSAAATPIVYQGLGEASLARVAVTGAGPAWANTTIWAEEYKWPRGSGAAGYDIYDPSFYAYCVGLLQSSLNARTVALRSTDLMTPASVPDTGGKAVWLFNSYAPGAARAASSRPGAKIDATRSAIELQVAIWAAVLDPANDVLSGTFKVNAITAIKSKTIDILVALHRGGPSGFDAGAATWLDPDGMRDPIDRRGVAEPRPLVMLATGVGPAIAARRLRRTTRSR
jgi:hypothetical protein